jgi:hypothetical protein
LTNALEELVQLSDVDIRYADYGSGCVTIIISCPKHPYYRAHKAPKDCLACSVMYAARNTYKPHLSK